MFDVMAADARQRPHRSPAELLDPTLDRAMSPNYHNVHLMVSWYLTIDRIPI